MSATSTARSRRTRGGRGGAEPRVRIEERERQVWDLSVLGSSQREIAAQLQLSQPAVCKIRRRLLDRHAAALTGDVSRQHALFAARLERIFADSMRGYARSQADEVSKTQRRIQGVGSTTAPQDLHALRTRTRPGDPRFLKSALEATLALQQAQAPAPTAATDAVDLTGLSAAELEVLSKLMERRDIPSTAGAKGESSAVTP
jgi:DNA-binding CsgD family transcriptional regulator